MAYYNKVLLMGNLTRTPDLKYTPNGSAVTEFGLAVNRTYTSNGEKKEETCFIDINVWGKQAESVSKYLQKGSPAFIEGRLQLDKWDDKETGKARTKLRVVAERVQFIGAPKTGNYDDAPDYNQSAQSAPPPAMPSPTGQQPPVSAFSNQNQQPPPVAPPQMPTPPPVTPAPVQNFTAAPPQPAAAQGAAPPPAPAPGTFKSSTETEDDIPF